MSASQAPSKDASFTNMTVNKNLVVQTHLQANSVTVNTLQVDNTLVAENAKISGNLIVDGKIQSSSKNGSNEFDGNTIINNGTFIVNNGSTDLNGPTTINGSLNVNGPVTVANGNTLNLDTITKNGTTLSWPPSDGLVGAVLTTNGAGELEFKVPLAPGTGNVFAPVPFVTNHALIRVNNASSSLNVEDSTVTLSDTANLSGLNVVTANQVVAPILSGTATNAINFTGTLVGDVSGHQTTTKVDFVGGSSATSVNSAAIAVANATSSTNVPGTLVIRDGSGNFKASTITAPNLIGNASTATFATTAGTTNTSTNFSGLLAGDVSGSQSATVVNLVGGALASNVASATTATMAASSSNVNDTIVKRDSGGSFSATNITATNFLGNATTATFSTTAGSSSGFSGSLAGDVSGSQAATVVANVPGSATFPSSQTGSTVASGAQLANSSTNTNTPLTIVRRDGLGNVILNSVTAGGGFVGNVTGNLNGTATNATNATTAVSFTGPLVGDVTGTQSTTHVVVVGGATASDIASATAQTLASTNLATPSTIVRRDGSGNASFGQVNATTATIGTTTGNLIGNASTATSATSATTFTGSLGGDVTGTQSSTVVGLVGGQTAANVALATIAANGALASNVANAIVKRDALGNFAANDITVNSNAATTSMSAPRFTVTGPITLATDATSKDYVDSTFATGSLVLHDPAQALAANNIVLSGTQTIDMVPLVVGNRVLAVGQTDPVQNGLWVVAAGTWPRPTDFADSTLAGRAYVLIDKPAMDNVYGGSSWLCSTPLAKIGEDPIEFIQFSVANNTNANNIGATGVGVFANKVSNTLNFKKINSTSAPYITVTDSGTTVDVSTNATSSNVATSLVARDGTGTFAGSLTGAASLNVLKTGDSMTGILNMKNQNGISFENLAGDKTVTLRAPNVIGTSWNMELPVAAPEAGQFLQATSNSKTRWVSFAGNQAIAPRMVYVSKGGSDVSGDGTLVSPFLTLERALILANSIASYNNPVVVDVGPGRYVTDNSAGGLPVTANGITIVGVSLTGTKFVPSILANDLLNVTSSFFECFNCSFDSESNGGSTGAAININVLSSGQIGIHTVLVFRFFRGLVATSPALTPLTLILAEFQAIANAIGVLSTNCRLIVETALFLGAASGNVAMNEGIEINGTGSLSLVSGTSFRLFSRAMYNYNGAQMRMIGSTIEQCSQGVQVSLGGQLSAVGCNWIGSNSSTTSVQVEHSSSIAEITGCSFNGGTGTRNGVAIECIDDGAIVIASSTISNYNTAIVCGQVGDVNTTSIRAQGVSVQTCNNDIIHNGSSTLYYVGGLVDPSKASIDDPTNVKLSSFNDGSVGTFVIGNTTNVSQDILQILNAEMSSALPKLVYNVNYYGGNGLVYVNTNSSDTLTGTESDTGNATNVVVTADRAKTSELKLISDTGVIGTSDNVRGWSIRKLATTANLAMEYVNTDSSGQALTGEHSTIELDGLNNCVIFPQSVVAPLPTYVYPRLSWGPLVDNTNLYRLSLGNLKTDANLSVGALASGFALTSGSGGLLQTSVTTSTELGYLAGATSNVQTQINGKVSKAGDTMTGTLVLPLGSAATPSLSFVGFPGTGVHSSGSGNIALSTGGADIINIASSGLVNISSLNTTGVVHTSAIGDLSASLVVGNDIASNTIPDSKLQTITSAGKVSNSATTGTSALSANTLVLRDGSNNFSANIITASLNGNATSATTAGSSTGFTGNLAGDVTGTQSATVVSSVGGQLAANVASGSVIANTATNLNTASSVVWRDASGNFAAGIISAALNGNASTSTNFVGALSGNVTGTQTATVVSAVPGAADIAGTSATNVAFGANLANAAVSTNTASAIVRRDGSGNFSAGTVTASLNGNATSATTSITSTNFSGSLAGDVTGTQSATTVFNVPLTATIVGQSGANTQNAILVANAATNLNTASAIVKRDASGNFTAGTITAALNGNASTSTNFTGSLVGNVTGTQGATVVSSVPGAADIAGTSATNVAAGSGLANAATSANSASAIVRRDASGNFSAGTITANLLGSSTTFTGSLAGNVTGTQSATVVASVGGQTAANVASGAVLANASTNLNTVSTIVRRDASGNFSAGTITATLNGNATSSNNFSGALVGDVTGNQSATTVSTVGGQSAINVASGSVFANTSTSSNTPSSVVYRNGSGAFSAGIITATLNGSSTNFSGALAGDVTGTQGATVVSSVGGQTAASVAAGSVLANTATAVNTPSSVVYRDASGNFSAGTITATINGSSTNFSGSLVGDVTGTQGATVVSSVGGQTAANVATGTALANAATNLNTASTIVRRDASGNFVATTISATTINTLQTINSQVTNGLTITGTTSGPASCVVINGPTGTGSGPALTINGPMVAGTANCVTLNGGTTAGSIGTTLAVIGSTQNTTLPALNVTCSQNASSTGPAINVIGRGTGVGSGVTMTTGGLNFGNSVYPSAQATWATARSVNTTTAAGYINLSFGTTGNLIQQGVSALITVNNPTCVATSTVLLSLQAPNFVTPGTTMGGAYDLQCYLVSTLAGGFTMVFVNPANAVGGAGIPATTTVRVNYLIC